MGRRQGAVIDVEAEVGVVWVRVLGSVMIISDSLQASLRQFASLHALIWLGQLVKGE